MDFPHLKSQKGPVLITGHTGFKGAWLSLLLNRLGIKHHGFAFEAEINSLFQRADLASFVPTTIGDIRDLNQVSNCFKQVHPSTVIHMAAQPLVLKSYAKPLDTFHTNVVGTANVLNIAFDTPSVQAVLVVTTDKVYKNNNSGQRFSETDPLFGHDPYSASKVGTEMVCAAWQKISSTNGGPKLVVARAGNVIGGGDSAENRIIPDIIRGIILKHKVVIRNPYSTRPWQHALDPVIGYLMYLESILAGTTKTSALNFGPHESSLEVSKLLEIGKEVFGDRLSFVIAKQEVGKEAPTLELDANLAREEIGWTPSWSQAEAIFDTFTWWKELLINSREARQLCSRDIDFLFRNWQLNY